LETPETKARAEPSGESPAGIDGSEENPATGNAAVV